jgi:hypothetical protein
MMQVDVFVRIRGQHSVSMVFSSPLQLADNMKADSLARLHSTLSETAEMAALERLL